MKIVSLSKQYMAIFFAVAIMTTLVVSSCNEPTILGADTIPAVDNVNVFYTDTMTLRTKTVNSDSVKVYDGLTGLILSNLLVGHINDPVFGEATAESYTQMFLSTTLPNFSNTRFDSIVLKLQYSTTGAYGDLTSPQTLEVYRISEQLDDDAAYYTNQTVQATTKIGEYVNFIAAPMDSILIDTLMVAPHISFHLDPAFGEELLDTNLVNDGVYNSNVDFAQYFNGFVVRPSASNEAMLRFNFSGPFSRVEMYYTQDDTVSKSLTFLINPNSAVRGTSISQDATGSIAEMAINSTAASDSLIYVQGMEGPNIKIEFPYAHFLDDVVVNKAEIEIRVADTTNIDDYPMVAQFLVSSLGDDGELDLINDVGSSLNAGSFALLGGTLEEEVVNGVTLYKYVVNISGHFQDIVDDLHIQDNNAIYLQAYEKAQRANRTIIGGSAANNSLNGMKLKLTYTKID